MEMNWQQTEVWDSSNICSLQTNTWEAGPTQFTISLHYEFFFCVPLLDFKSSQASKLSLWRCKPDTKSKVAEAVFWQGFASVIPAVVPLIHHSKSVVKIPSCIYSLQLE